LISNEIKGVLFALQLYFWSYAEDNKISELWLQFLETSFYFQSIKTEDFITFILAQIIRTV